MSTTLHWAALILYLAGTLVFLAFLLGQKRALSRMGQGILWLGLLCHTLALGSAWLKTGVFPALSLRQSLDVFSWGVMAAGLIINLRLKVLILGALIAPLSCVLLTGAAVLPAVDHKPGELVSSIWVASHVMLILLAYGLLAVNFLAGLLYIIQDSRIRSKSLGAVFKRIPPLSLLDSMGRHSLTLGFTLMTIGLIIGAVYAQITLGSFLRFDPKENWALITWLIYAGLLHTRLVQGWRGRKSARLSVIAFCVLLFSFIGAGLLYPGYHSFESFTSGKGPLR